VRLFCDPRQGCARHYPAGFSIIILKAFDVKELTGSVEVMRATILLFFFFGLSTAGLTYCLTYLFKSASTAQNLVIFLNVICMFLIMASFIMGRVDSTCKADKSLQYIWMLLPSYSVGYGFVKVWHWGGSCWLSVFSWSKVLWVTVGVPGHLAVVGCELRWWYQAWFSGAISVLPFLTRVTDCLGWMVLCRCCSLLCTKRWT
jgi:hypothetical protein